MAKQAGGGLQHRNRLVFATELAASPRILDACVVEAALRIRRQKRRHCALVDLAVVIPNLLKSNEHIGVLGVVADALDHAAI